MIENFGDVDFLFAQGIHHFFICFIKVRKVFRTASFIKHTADLLDISVSHTVAFF